MSEKSGKLRSCSCCCDFGRRGDGVEAEQKQAGVIDKEEEDRGDEHCDGQDGKEHGAVGGGREGGDRKCRKHEGNVVHDVDDEVKRKAGETNSDSSGVEKESEGHAGGGGGGGADANEDKNDPRCCGEDARGGKIERRDGVEGAAGGGDACGCGHGGCNNRDDEWPAQRCKFKRNAQNVHANSVR